MSHMNPFHTLKQYFLKIYSNIVLPYEYMEARGRLVVKALWYNPKGRGIEIRWGEWYFLSIYLILPAVLGPGVYSTSNRNEYQKQKKIFLEVECGQCEGLTSLASSVSRLSGQCGILNISQHYRPPRPVTGIDLLYGDGVCFLWGTNWTVSTATSSQYLAVNCEPIV
jgi:hypothetical protein